MEKGGQYRKNTLGMLCFALSLIIGLYFLNLGFNKLIPLYFITDPVNNIILIIGGILIIVGGFVFMRRSSSMQRIR